MPAVKDQSMCELLASLQEWQLFGSGELADIFIGAVGFEDRTASCFAAWAEQRKAGGQALLLYYPFNKPENALHEQEFLEAAEKFHIKIVRLDYTHRSLFSKTVNALSKLDNPKGILLDLSSLGSFAFYPLMTAIFDAAPEANLTIGYTEAKEYFPKQSEWASFQSKVLEFDLYQRARLFDEQHFQSKGVDNVFECASFIGQNPDNLPSSLIVIPNFSIERVNRMIDYTSERYSIPRDRYVWIVGTPPDSSKNGWRHDALWEMFDKPGAKREASTLHYKEMLLTLHQLWEEKHTSESLVIATVGSKAQHLATYLFLTMHPEVALVLSEPKEFTASKYSEGIGKQWRLNLGRVDKLLLTLRQWNCISFNW